VIVAGHIGYPWTTEMITLARKYPNIYIDTSAYKASRYPAELVEYIRSNGCRKVLFGSNHPAWPATECLADFPALGLDDDTAHMFLHGNAERVFDLQVHPRLTGSM
jgi:predicted TIM-barrel fold metal-dependent hydrolase